MTQELNQQMATLRAIGPKLNQASNDAARIIAEVESFLNKLNLGVPGLAPWFRSVNYRSPEVGPDPRRQDAYRLAYGRGEDGKFCIHILVETCGMAADHNGEADFADDLYSTIVPWSRASRSDRLQSFATLPALLASIAGNSQRQMAGAEATIAQVDETLKTLGLTNDPTGTPATEPPPRPKAGRKAS